jgi:hypothetical protein
MIVPRPAERPPTRAPLQTDPHALTNAKDSGAIRRSDGIELYCPFDAGLNPHVEEVQRASVEWAYRLGLVRSNAHRNKLARSKIAWLTARGFPFASREVLQLAADWTTLFCLLDDRLEARVADPLDLSTYFVQLLDAFVAGTIRPGLDPVSTGLVDLQQRFTELTGKSLLERFTNVFRELLGGFLWEEINRWKRFRPKRDAYRTMRQITVGLRPQFVLGEIAAGIELPANVRVHDSIATLESITCTAIGWANDIFTCTKELGQDHAHNIVLLVMDEESRSLVDVVRNTAAGHNELVRNFESIEQELPRHLSEDSDVRSHISTLRYWIRGHLDWARETGRYQSDSNIANAAP